jgi:hypothetical protein
MSDQQRPDGVDNATINTEVDETGTDGTETAETVESAPETQLDANADKPADDADTFPREYVETLRKENADYRTKAKAAEEQSDALSIRLHRELVTATGRLENPADLDYRPEHLDDADALAKAVDALLTDRPYFAKRKVTGDAGQGARGGEPEPVSLLGLLRGKR